MGSLCSMWRAPNKMMQSNIGTYVEVWIIEFIVNEQAVPKHKSVVWS